MTAQGIAARMRRDGETRLDPKGKSPVGNADAPKDCRRLYPHLITNRQHKILNHKSHRNFSEPRDRNRA